jgi:hypothetical protein
MDLGTPTHTVILRGVLFTGIPTTARTILPIFLLLGMAAAGCEVNRATGPHFTEQGKPESHEAIIYFYRPPRLEAPSRYSNRIYDSGRLIGVLDHGGYFVYVAQPGRHRLSLSKKDNPDDLWLGIKGGQSYFIQWDYIIALSWGATTNYGAFIKPVDATDALKELQRCRLMQPGG